MAVNQQQIADALNISVATVSRAMRGDVTISNATRAQVLEMASRLGYSIAVSGRTRRTLNCKNPEDTSTPFCALIHHDMVGPNSSFLLQRFLTGMSAAANEYQRPLIVHYIADQETDALKKNDSLPVALRNSNIIGAVLINCSPNKNIRKLCEKINCVALDDRWNGILDAISMNEIDAISEITQELIRRGHTKIGFAGDLKQHIWVRRRFSGYLEALGQQDIDYDPQTLFKLDAFGQDLNCLEQIKEAADRGMTAIVAATDLAAYAIKHHLDQLGMPITVTGFDAIKPPLDMTQIITARMPAEEMGATAIRALYDRWKHPTMPTRNILLNVKIIMDK